MGKGLHKSKSNFTLKRLHQSGNYGNIYERDILTIVGGGFAPEGQIPINTTPSFKLSVRAGYNGRKIHNYGEWLINTVCPDNEYVWTINCTPTPVKNDSNITTKTNSCRLSDFVCYSSASELIRSSLEHIINNFPAEIYVDSSKLLGVESRMFDDLVLRESDLYEFLNTSNRYYLLKNPFNIDLTRLAIPEDNVSSPLRYFCKSFDKYQIIDDDGLIYDVVNWYMEEPETSSNVTCITDGTYLGRVVIESVFVDDDETEEDKTIYLYVFYLNKNIIFLSENPNYCIRPNEKSVNDFFDNLDDFQKILLNRNTEYTSKIDTYIEDEEKGWYIIEKKYQWPKDANGWNIAINGVDYMQFVNSLSELALGYDENVTDAIWRTMTHEAISNMDSTITRNGEEEYLNSSRMKKILTVIGRQFDEIKRDIDTIKNSNKITYTQENDTPNYFLSDWLELSGWETKRLFNGVSESIVTPEMYPSRTIGFTANDANNEFIRRLKLNSGSILAKKGTKQGIEDLLAIFGYHSVNWLKQYYGTIPSSSELYALAYEIKEFNYKLNEIQTDEGTITDVKIINSEKTTYEDGAEDDTIVNPYQGLPVTDVFIDGNYYFIPWFDKNEKYDGDLYFQSKGGWMKDVKYSSADSPVYDYTASNIYAYNTLESVYEGFKKPGYYFYIQNLNKCYTYSEEKSDFILYPPVNTQINDTVPETERTSYKYIYVNGNYYRWSNRPSDINSINTIEIFKEEDLKKKEEYEEDGKTYTKYVKYLDDYYQWDDNNNEYVRFARYVQLDGKPFNAYLEAGRLEDVINEFVDTNKGNNPHTGTYDNGDSYIASYRNWFGNSNFGPNYVHTNYGFETAFNVDTNNKCVIVDDNNLLDSLYTLNTKHFLINFDERYEEFIRENILPYLKQMIPSTTIVEYDFIRLGTSQKIEFTIVGRQDDTNVDMFEINPPFSEDDTNTLVIAGELLPTNKVNDYVLMDETYFKWYEHYVLIDESETIPDSLSTIKEVKNIPSEKYKYPNDATDENTIVKTFITQYKKVDGYDYVKHNDIYYEWVESEDGTGEYVEVRTNLTSSDYIICKDRYFKWCERYEMFDSSFPEDSTNANTLIINGNILPSEEKEGYTYIKLNDIYYKWENDKYVRYNADIPIEKVTVLSGYTLPTEKCEGYLFIIFKGRYYEWVDDERKYVEMVDKPIISIVNGETLPTAKYEDSKYIIFNSEYYEWINGKYEKIDTKPTSSII